MQFFQARYESFTKGYCDVFIFLFYKKNYLKQFIKRMVIMRLKKTHARKIDTDIKYLNKLSQYLRYSRTSSLIRGN